MTRATDLLISRADLRDTRLAGTDLPPLAEGEARLAVRRFALTANNVTYAVFGDMMQYWNFFPAPDGQGRVGVWGYADVVESRSDLLAVGERLFGYLPFGDTLVIQPGGATKSAVKDMSPWRQPMSPFYNEYVRCAADPSYDPALENEACLYRPLFMTGFLLDAWLADAGQFGTTRVIASSASSKTALAMAYGVSRRQGVEMIALTSQRNVDFVRTSGFYSDILTYDAIADLAGVDAVYVDFAGDGAVTGAVHSALRDHLKHSAMVGGAHWDASRAPPAEGPTPELFFAPAVLAQRMAEWGPAGFQARYGAAWRGFLDAAGAFMGTRKLAGLAEGQTAWAALLDGSASPQTGLVVVIDGPGG